MLEERELKSQNFTCTKVTLEIEWNWKKIKAEMCCHFPIALPFCILSRLQFFFSLFQVPSEVYLPDKTCQLVTLFHKEHREDGRIKRVLHLNF